MRKKIQKIAVVGAGPAGLTAAYLLSKQGFKIDVYEQSNQVGGMCKTLSLWGQLVDLGPHRFFSNDKRVNSLWLEVIGNKYQMVNRLTRIYYKKKFYYYPVQAFDAVSKLGVINTVLIIVSYLWQKIKPRKTTDTFEEWVTQKFGKRLYSIFFKTYTEKLWGIKCSNLDADFARQRIKKLSLSEAIKNALNFSKQQNKHATLVDSFAYPVGGTGSVYAKMKSKATRRGVNFFLDSSVDKIDVDDKDGQKVTLWVNKRKTKKYDFLISSMPLTDLVKNLNKVPDNIVKAANKLTYRNTILVFLEVLNDALFPDQWLYIHDPFLQVGRITNFRNWIPSLYKNKRASILAMEYWANDDEGLWNKSQAEIAQLAKREIVATALVKKPEIKKAEVYKLSKSYPVYKRNYKKHLKKIQDYLSTYQNIFPIGRYGSFKYNNQDHSILMGILAVEKILGTNHNLWEINTDYEYQEGYVITKRGLRKQ